MAVIKAKGITQYGEMEVTILGTDMVQSVESPDPAAADFIRKLIHDGEGEMANAYHPEPDTMLQAAAVCYMLFDRGDIEFDGEIEPMEGEEGMIY